MHISRFGETLPDKPRPVSNLATLLDSHRDEIASRWLEAIHHLQGSLHAGLPDQDLFASLTRGVSGLAEILATGSTTALDSFLTDVTSLRLRQDFDIGEVIEGLLLLREAALPTIQSVLEPQATKEVTDELDAAVRCMLRRFGQLFAAAMRQESEALQRVSAALLEMRDLSRVLDIVCAEARRLAGAESSVVFLLEENGPGGVDWLRVAHKTGDAWPSYDGLPVDRSFTGMVVRTGKARLTNDPSNEPSRVRSSVEPESLLAVPLILKGAAIGALDLANKPGGFTDEDLRMMGLFADQAAIAIENARLKRQVERLAVIEERQRLARELHDSVNQSLYSMRLFAEAAGGLIAAGNYDKAMDHLGQLRETAQESLREMRLLIFELRPPVLEREGLVAALQARLDSVEARGDVQCKLFVEGDERLPAPIEEELYRIAMEALNNAFKHSRAQRVTVQVRFSEDETRLEVCDDGVGFEPACARGKGGLGLTGMAERARRIGATLRVNSSPGRGTSVQVEARTARALSSGRQRDG